MHGNCRNGSLGTSLLVPSFHCLPLLWHTRSWNDTDLGSGYRNGYKHIHAKPWPLLFCFWQYQMWESICICHQMSPISLAITNHLRPLSFNLPSVNTHTVLLMVSKWSSKRMMDCSFSARATLLSLPLRRERRRERWEGMLDVESSDNNDNNS